MRAIQDKLQFLEEQLRCTDDTKAKVDQLNDLAYELRHTDTSLSLQRSREAIELAEKVTYQKGLAEALLNEGFAEMVLANYGEALQVLSKATQMFDNLKDEQGQGRALYNVSLVYRNIGDFNQALESFQQSLAVRQSVSDQDGEAACLMQLGYINI